jgi:hypothetical protein
VKLDAGNATGRNTPVMGTKVIHADYDGPDFANQFDYRSVIGKLNYLENAPGLI